MREDTGHHIPAGHQSQAGPHPPVAISHGIAGGKPLQRAAWIWDLLLPPWGDVWRDCMPRRTRFRGLGQMQTPQIPRVLRCCSPHVLRLYLCSSVPAYAQPQKLPSIPCPSPPCPPPSPPCPPPSSNKSPPPATAKNAATCWLTTVSSRMPSGSMTEPWRSSPPGLGRYGDGPLLGRVSKDGRMLSPTTQP